MTSAEFDRAAAIFLAVRALPLADRPTRLDESCGADRALRAAVERLLAHDDGGDDEDDALTPLDEVVRVATAEALAPDLAGRVIGRVRIIRCIATGGMGSVYEGEQDEPRRRVAVKVLRPGLASPSMLHRFRHEAHLLGRLRHPGIVPIFDAGTTEIDGRRQPYLVMEYIEGPTLTAFAAERTLDDAARLRLIAAVCDAIEHAHQKGVIHRDLKPANILVDTDRDEPQPKILDFGIARTIEDDRFLTTMRTDVGQVLGTLAYMSPEQIAADPDALDTRSDVYAIGVIAYELLAGRLPLDLARRPLPDAARIVADTEPTPLGAIRRALRGDVETIVATAMEKERDRRYASAAMMAADLRRHLAGEPILARPPTMTYLLGRFARRHRALVGAVIAAFLLLVIAVVGTSTGLVRANAAARRAERMNEYLRGMIAWFDPGGAEGQAVTMAQVLDEAVARIDRDLVDEPAVAASLYTTLGTGYYSLLRLDDAERCLRHAIDCHAAVGESDSVESGEAHMTLGIVAMRRNALDEARTHIDAAIRIFTKDGAAAFELAQAQSELATLEKESDHLTEAEALFELALPVLRALDHEGGPLGSALNNWGALKRIRGDLPAAETLTREALEVVRRRRGDQHLDTAMVLNNLGFIISRQNRLADAEPLYRESLDIRRRLFGADSAQLAVPLNNLGKLYLDLDRLDDAEPLLDAALDIRRRTLGDHTHTANAMENLATVRAQRGRTVEAEAGFREALAMRGRLFAPDHQTVIASRIKLAKFLVGADRPAEAIEEVHVALDTLRGRAEPEPLVRFIALNTLALADQALQRYDEAAAAYTEALDAVRGTAIDGSDDANTVRANYATLLIDLGRSVEAEHLLRDAGVQLRANLPAMHSSVALTDLYLARALIAQGRLAEAEAPARDAYDVLHALRGPENGLTRDAARTLVALYEAWDRPADRATWAARLADEPPDPSPAP